MAGWSQHRGMAIAYPQENVDTDQLIPARFMSVPRSDGYGPYLLYDQRFDADGAEASDMPLNRHPNATVLVSRRNFGTGSSREAAVYALIDFGIKAVIAPSFGDIFAGNAINNGLLPARVETDLVETLITSLKDASLNVQIDLEAKTAVVGRITCPFGLDPIWQTKLLNGWDDIDLTSSHKPQIEAFKTNRSAACPWVWPTMK